MHLFTIQPRRRQSIFRNINQLKKSIDYNSGWKSAKNAFLHNLSCILT